MLRLSKTENAVFLDFLSYACAFVNNSCFAAAGYQIVAMLNDKYMCYTDPLHYYFWTRSCKRKAVYCLTFFVRMILNIIWIPYMDVSNSQLSVNVQYAASHVYTAFKVIAAILQYLLTMILMLLLLRAIRKISNSVRIASETLNRNQTVSNRLHTCITCIYIATNVPYMVYDAAMAFITVNDVVANEVLDASARALFFLQACGSTFNCLAACMVCKEYRNVVIRVFRFSARMLRQAASRVCCNNGFHDLR